MGKKTKLLTDVDAGREGWREKIKILTFVDAGIGRWGQYRFGY